MFPCRMAVMLVLPLAALLLAGCTEETADLKQQIAIIEKKLQKQETDLRDFTGKFSPTKDFSADIQRIEDQQDKISEVLKTKVEPINSKLEEFRDWAQEAQKDREAAAKKLKALEQSVVENQKKTETDTREVARFGKELAANKKSLTVLSKGLEDTSKSMVDLAKHLAELRREVLDNNTKMVSAVKKTLPKLKEAVLTDLKDKIGPMEVGLSDLKAALETDRKAAAAVKSPPVAPPETGKDIQALTRRTKDLEEILASQKSYLLEMGSKVHAVESQLKQAMEQ